MTWWTTTGKAMWARRRRWAPAVLAAGFVVLAGQALTVYPREVALHYRLGPSHSSILAVTLSYQLEGSEMAGAHFQWPDGAPDSLDHTLDLTPGRYRLRAEIIHRDGTRNVERGFEVPTEGILMIDLFSVGYAQRRIDHRPALPATPAG